jgi:hypothetical protein
VTRPSWDRTCSGVFVRPTMKRCDHCGDEKAVDQFDVFYEGANKRKRYRSKCRECMQLFVRVCACGCGEELPSTTPKIKRYRVGHNPEATRDRAEDRREYVRAWAHANPGKKLEHVLKHKFGLTLERYEELRAKQKNRCAICRKTEPGGNCKRWCVDHDHRTGEIRGLLCLQCNTGIGVLGDDVTGMRRAVAYFEPPKIDGISMGLLW